MVSKQDSKSQVLFVPQYFEVREVGKTIKSTKLQYVWRLRLNNEDNTVELFTSKLTSKKKVVVNGKIILEDKM